MANREVKNLVLLTLSASKIILNLEDEFFKKKLFSKLTKLIRQYISVAQYKEGFNTLNAEINNLIETIDYIVYSNSANPTPLLLLKRRVLNFKLLLLKNLKKLKVSKIETEKESKVDPVDRKSKSPPILKRKESISNKEKILSFIKRQDKIRAKDVIGEFSAVSGRTVKRTLKELTDDGLIKKEEADKVVYYSTT